MFDITLQSQSSHDERDMRWWPTSDQVDETWLHSRISAELVSLGVSLTLVKNSAGYFKRNCIATQTYLNFKPHPKELILRSFA